MRPSGGGFAGLVVGGAVDAAAAERLTALLEGLSMRRLSGGIGIRHARELMRGAIDAELAGLRQD
ncbi:hypothetical protein [Streptomyces jumonjinensis]|uniref:hypothetical protein n=1 Tax=Streptomyces jumonjinensis TaxID=1945 RepID=UPI0037A5C115